MYTYNAKLDRVVDGDTIDALVDLGFNTWKKVRIRMMGIDAPESRTRDKEEKKYGLMAKDYITRLLDDEGGIVLKTHKDGKGKFGRILGELWYGEVNINEKMIEEHHAVRYMGQSKEDIAEEHIKNRAFINLWVSL